MDLKTLTASLPLELQNQLLEIATKMKSESVAKTIETVEAKYLKIVNDFTEFANIVEGCGYDCEFVVKPKTSQLQMHITDNEGNSILTKNVMSNNSVVKLMLDIDKFISDYTTEVTDENGTDIEVRLIDENDDRLISIYDRLDCLNYTDPKSVAKQLKRLQIVTQNQPS